DGAGRGLVEAVDIGLLTEHELSAHGRTFELCRGRQTGRAREGSSNPDRDEFHANHWASPGCCGAEERQDQTVVLPPIVRMRRARVRSLSWLSVMSLPRICGRHSPASERWAH